MTIPPKAPLLALTEKDISLKEKKWIFEWRSLLWLEKKIFEFKGWGWLTIQQKKPNATPTTKVWNIKGQKVFDFIVVKALNKDLKGFLVLILLSKKISFLYWRHITEDVEICAERFDKMFKDFSRTTTEHSPFALFQQTGLEIFYSLFIQTLLWFQSCQIEEKTHSP